MIRRDLDRDSDNYWPLQETIYWRENVYNRKKGENYRDWDNKRSWEVVNYLLCPSWATWLRVLCRFPVLLRGWVHRRTHWPVRLSIKINLIFLRFFYWKRSNFAIYNARCRMNLAINRITLTSSGVPLLDVLIQSIVSRFASLNVRQLSNSNTRSQVHRLSGIVYFYFRVNVSPTILRQNGLIKWIKCKKKCASWARFHRQQRFRLRSESSTCDGAWARQEDEWGRRWSVIAFSGSFFSQTHWPFFLSRVNFSSYSTLNVRTCRFSIANLSSSPSVLRQLHSAARSVAKARELATGLEFWSESDLWSMVGGLKLSVSASKSDDHALLRLPPPSSSDGRPCAPPSRNDCSCPANGHPYLIESPFLVELTDFQHFFTIISGNILLWSFWV